MATTTKPKQSLVGIEMVRLLAYEGDRIFTTDRARELAPRVGLKDAYVAESLYHLRRNNWIVSLRRGLYALSATVPGVAAAHEFEIAMALVDPAMISHWSAFQHHGADGTGSEGRICPDDEGNVDSPLQGEQGRGDLAAATRLGIRRTDSSRLSVTASSALRRFGSAMPACPSPIWSERCWTGSPCHSIAATSLR